MWRPASFLKVRSKWAVTRTEIPASFFPARSSFRHRLGRLVKLGKKILDGSCSAAPDVLVAVPNLFLKLRVSRLQVILQLLSVHEPRYGDAIPFQNEVLLVDVDSLDDCTEVVAGFGERNTMDRGSSLCLKVASCLRMINVEHRQSSNFGNSTTEGLGRERLGAPVGDLRGATAHATAATFSQPVCQMLISTPQKVIE